jgi:alkylation response protein AidB-like acyl-CoA dehydrogenase
LSQRRFWSISSQTKYMSWRDARLTKIFEGTSEIQQRIISDHLLGKPKAA